MHPRCTFVPQKSQRCTIKEFHYFVCPELRITTEVLLCRSDRGPMTPGKRSKNKRNSPGGTAVKPVEVSTYEQMRSNRCDREAPRRDPQRCAGSWHSTTGGFCGQQLDSRGTIKSNICPHGNAQQQSSRGCAFPAVVHDRTR